MEEMGIKNMKILCVACGSENIEEHPELPPDEWIDYFYRCKNCSAENGKLYVDDDGRYLLYPNLKDRSLFRHYSPAEGLDAEEYEKGDIVHFSTPYKEINEAEVIYVVPEDNVLVIMDLEGGKKRRLLVESRILEEAFEKSTRGKTYINGWKHRAVALHIEPKELPEEKPFNLEEEISRKDDFDLKRLHQEIQAVKKFGKLVPSEVYRLLNLHRGNMDPDLFFAHDFQHLADLVYTEIAKRYFEEADTKNRQWEQRKGE